MTDLKMPDINNVLIAGVLTSDPSFRKTTNGTAVTNFYLVSNRKFKDNAGQWRDNVCYVGVVAWYKLAESCFENLKRGSAVLIDGELQSRNWKNDDGTSRSVVEVKARRIQFLNRRSLDGVGEEKAGDLAGTEAVLDGSVDEHSESETQIEKKVESEIQYIGKTDFDFGYQNLE